VTIGWWCFSIDNFSVQDEGGLKCGYFSQKADDFMKLGATKMTIGELDFF